MVTAERMGGNRLRVRPDAVYLDAFAKDMEDVLTKTVEKFRKQDLFYNNKNIVWPQQGNSRTSYHTGKAAAIIRQAVDTQFSYDVKVHRDAVGEAENAETLADDVETWMANVYKAVIISMPLHPLKQFNFNLLLHGKAFLEGPRFRPYPMEDEEPEREPDEDKEDYETRLHAWKHERANWNPFTLRSPHPRDILCDPWARHPEEYIFRKELYAFQLAALTEKWRAMGKDGDLYVPNKRNERVILEEYFSRYWHIMRIKGGPLLVAERNTLDSVPIQQVYSTYGWEQTDEDVSDPADLCGGLLDSINDVLTAIDQNASAAHEQNIRKAYASTISKQGGREGVEIQTALARGEGIGGASPDDVGVVEYPEVGVSLREEQDRLESYATDGTYTPALLGIHQPGVTTVGQQTILSRAASRKFQAVAANDEAAATVWAENVLRLMDAYGGDVTMRGVTIGRKHIKGVYALSVTFDNSDFLVQQQERADVREDYKNGLISDETARFRLGYENESQERNRKIKQLAREDPNVVRILVEKAIEDLGISADDLAQTGQRETARARLQSGRGVGNQSAPVIFGPDGQPVGGAVNPGQVDLRSMGRNGAANAP